MLFPLLLFINSFPTTLFLPSSPLSLSCPSNLLPIILLGFSTSHHGRRLWTKGLCMVVDAWVKNFLSPFVFFYETRTELTQWTHRGSSTLKISSSYIFPVLWRQAEDIYLQKSKQSSHLILECNLVTISLTWPVLVHRWYFYCQCCGVSTWIYLLLFIIITLLCSTQWSCSVLMKNHLVFMWPAVRSRVPH